jgi:SNF2 family DNA or RNA helicase
MKYTPHEYQHKAIQFCLENNYAGLFLEPGLGKTSIIMQAAKILLAKKFIKGVLVIAPLRPVYLVWPNEIRKWDEFKGLRMEILHGPSKEKALATKADIYVINPEGLSWLFSQGLFRKKDWPFDMLVVDESTMFKNTATSRFHMLRPKLSKFKRRYILTGTPTPNNVGELFGQIYLLDQGKALGNYISHFHNKYCYQDTYGWVVVKGAEKIIYNKVAPLVLQMSAEDYLKLPELQINDVYVELPDKVRKHYKEMEKQLRTEFDFGRVNAVNASVKAGKCRQIASGAVYVGAAGPLKPKPPLQGWQQIHTEKIEAVRELVDELMGQPVLIGYEYEHEAERLKKEFPHAVSLGGGSTPKQQKIAEVAWNKGEIPILLNQMDSGSLGLNLQGSGNNIILFTPTYKFQSYTQFIQRIWRQGHVTQRVRVHRILARDTLDTVITHGVLESKAAGQGALFKALKDYLSAQNPP